MTAIAGDRTRQQPKNSKTPAHHPRLRRKRTLTACPSPTAPHQQPQPPNEGRTSESIRPQRRTRNQQPGQGTTPRNRTLIDPEVVAAG